MTRPSRYWSGDDTPTDLRQAAPEIATDDADDTAGYPIDSFWFATVLIGLVLSTGGLIAMGAAIWFGGV